MASELPATPTWARQGLALAVPLAAWATYARLGLKYLLWVVCCALATALLARAGRGAWRQVPAIGLLLAFTACMQASALWSTAPSQRLLAHAWSYLIPLLTVPMLAACPANIGRRGLQHFVAASAVVGLLSVSQALGMPALEPVLSSTVGAEGNQRIVTSLLLAMGAALGIWFSTRTCGGGVRTAWFMAALLAAAGLANQDRRSGMVVLPVMLVVWILASRGHLRRRGVLMLALGLLSLVAISQLHGVQARFAEGLAEVRAYRSTGEVVTSWGQRLRMLELSAGMVAERPLLGHGLADWKSQWDQRVDPGSALALNTTPHNELLLVAVQAGLPTALLLLGWLLSQIAASARRSPLGVPALMIWSALTVAGLFNAVLRDAKFALPLLLLAAMATALARAGQPPPDPSGVAPKTDG